MKVEFTHFAFTDLLHLDVQPAHSALPNLILGRMLALKGLMEGPYSWSGWTPYGRLIVCAGILPNGLTWALLSKGIQKEFITITRKAQAVFETFPGEVLATIDETSKEAVRWVTLLGFEPAESQPEIWVLREGQ